MLATNTISDSRLLDELGAFRAWTRTQIRLLGELQPWLKRQGLYTTEIRHAIESALQALHDDRVTVVVAGEFSRGKTELINALFFASFGRRLLPADAGRTTMCPTEIYCESGRPPRLSLLPIETRADARTMTELRADPAQWQVFDLDLAEPEAVSGQLQLLTEVKQVSRQEAANLGLMPAGDGQANGCVSIPRWRLALINIHHPLLAKGLRVLDTPGLNALGSEPELTYEILPTAHAVLFVLAADAGVTQSDLEIWQGLVQRPGLQQRRGLMVVLNKTDTLWDELRPSEQVAESIIRQCQGVSKALQVAPEQVFATSAHKALVSRVRMDRVLERRSGITSLESYLGRVMTGNRVELIQLEHTQRVREAIDMLEAIVRGRLQRNEQQRQSLLDLAHKSDGAINRILQATQADHQRYRHTLDAYAQILATFRQHSQTLLDALDTDALEHTLEGIRESMTGAWTTHGLKEAMGMLFREIDRRLRSAGEQTQAMRRLLRAAHQRFQSEHNLRPGAPTLFSMIRYQVELSLLNQEAETFRSSLRTTLMEQRFVTRRYFGTIVKRARRVLDTAHEDARHWSAIALTPLSAEIQGYRDTLVQQIDDLRQTGRSRRTIEQRIAALKRDTARLHAQLSSMGKARGLLTARPTIRTDMAGQRRR